MSTAVELTEANWEEAVLGSPKPVLVDFWAPWCVPCRRVTPIVEEVAERLEGRLVLGTLNADEAPRITGRYGVMSLPTLLLFAGGEPVARVVGVPRIGRLEDMIVPHLDTA